ncbi:MAG: hypothetical protein WA973_21180 [Mesorhizobium sp.]
MRKAFTLFEIVPALVFAGLALFVLARLAIGAYPDDPLAWQAYLILAPLNREIGILLPANAFWAFLAVAILTAAACLALASLRNYHWVRTRFVLFHVALLAVLVGMRDERVFTVSTADLINIGNWPMPDFLLLDPVTGLMLLALTCACLGAHRAVISRLRAPLRHVS